MFTKSSSPWRITTSFPASAGSAGSPAWSVSQKRESRWLRDPRASTTSSSRARSAMSVPSEVAAGASPNALRMPPALARVSATS